MLLRAHFDAMMRTPSADTLPGGVPNAVRRTLEPSYLSLTHAAALEFRGSGLETKGAAAAVAALKLSNLWATLPAKQSPSPAERCTASDVSADLLKCDDPILRSIRGSVRSSAAPSGPRGTPRAKRLPSPARSVQTKGPPLPPARVPTGVRLLPQFQLQSGLIVVRRPRPEEQVSVADADDSHTRLCTSEAVLLVSQGHDGSWTGLDLSTPFSSATARRILGLLPAIASTGVEDRLSKTPLWYAGDSPIPSMALLHQDDAVGRRVEGTSHVAQGLWLSPLVALLRQDTRTIQRALQGSGAQRLPCVIQGCVEFSRGDLELRVATGDWAACSVVRSDSRSEDARGTGVAHVLLEWDPAQVWEMAIRSFSGPTRVTITAGASALAAEAPHRG